MCNDIFTSWLRVGTRASDFLLLRGPGCPTSCGLYTACSQTGKNIRSQQPQPRTRLYNKDNVVFQEVYECPEVNGIQCNIPTLYMNDDFCDCPGCEDEDRHNCTTCGTDLPAESQVLVTADVLLTCSEECGGTDSIAGACIAGGQALPEGVEVFTCTDGCQIQADAKDDGYCVSRFGHDGSVSGLGQDFCLTTFDKMQMQYLFDAKLQAC